jgi:hypothetical protein
MGSFTTAIVDSPIKPGAKDG